MPIRWWHNGGIGLVLLADFRQVQKRLTMRIVWKPKAETRLNMFRFCSGIAPIHSARIHNRRDTWDNRLQAHKWSGRALNGEFPV